MGPPPPMLANDVHATADLCEANSLMRASRAAIHDSAASHHHLACGPAPNLLCKPAAAQPVSAYQAFSREQRPLLSDNGIERRNTARSSYNTFCQAQRPFLPPDLRNSQREAALGQLWAALSLTERAKYAPAPAQAQAPPTAFWYHRSAPPLGEDRSRGKRAKIAAICFPSAALPTAPPAPLAPLAPLTPLARFAPTAPSGAPLAPPAAPAPPMAVPVPVPVPVLYYPIAVEGWEAAAAGPAPVAAGWATPFALTAPSTASTSPELLTAVATHRTFVEHFLGEDQQLARVAETTTLDLAEMMEQQMTEEEAMEIAFSLGMPE